MTKKRPAGRSAARRGRTRSTRNVSTPAASTRARGTRKSRAARASSAAAAAGAIVVKPGARETVLVTFTLSSASGAPLADPETMFTFRRLDGNRQVGDQLRLRLPGVSVPFAVPVDTEVLLCEVDPRRFRFSKSPVFFVSPGSPVSKDLTLLREPQEWTAQFTSWNGLSGAFDGLKDVLGVSPRVTLFRESTPIADLLVEDAYDGMSGQPVVLAKTALLNSYFRLSRTMEPVSGTRSWFSFVQRVMAIGRERFLGFVDPGMETLVRRIHTHIDEFRADYERTPAENHRDNVPPELKPRITSMVSIKSTHRKGNFQLTLTHLSSPDEVLLDADIDESGDLLGHFFDLFKHRVTGGTHPHDIHELLVLQEGKSPGFDLGYQLV